MFVPLEVGYEGLDKLTVVYDAVLHLLNVPFVSRGVMQKLMVLLYVLTGY